MNMYAVFDCIFLAGLTALPVAATRISSVSATQPEVRGGEGSVKGPRDGLQVGLGRWAHFKF